MRKSVLLKVVLALIVVLMVIDAIEAAKNPNKVKPKRQRRRMVHEAYDPNNVNPDDPYDEDEERPPMNPGDFHGSSTPKLVKGINLQGEKGAKEFQEMTDRLKMKGDDIETDMTTAMHRAHRHNKVLEKLRRQKIVEARKARASKANRP